MKDKRQETREGRQGTRGYKAIVSLVLCLVSLVSCLLSPVCAAEAKPRAAVPRVAVWNPEQGTMSSRFQIDLEWLNQVASWLVEDGIETSRLTMEQIEDAEQFSAMKFDAL